jgi:hypothetical protein
MGWWELCKMTENVAWVMLIGILIILFWGEPDIYDALINYMMTTQE